MRIIVYDPLYSNIGHFYRYNCFMVELLNSMEVIKEILVYSDDVKLKALEKLSKKITVEIVESKLDSMQIRSIQSKGIGKLRLISGAYLKYKKIITLINKSKFDIVLFTSQGQIPFWLSLYHLKKPYLVSCISIKWMYSNSKSEKILEKFFINFLKKSSLNLFTEELYKRRAGEFDVTNSIVMPDRYLEVSPEKKDRSMKGVINLVTLGTISSIKTPLRFVNEFIHVSASVGQCFQYSVYGKIIDNSQEPLKSVIKENNFIVFDNTYISDEKFENILRETDFVVIPYSSEYTKYVTSGVMWDCFTKQIPILCPKDPLFEYYISKYKVGYVYEYGALEQTLKQIMGERVSFSSALPANYNQLSSDFSRQNLLNLFEAQINSLSKKYQL